MSVILRQLSITFPELSYRNSYIHRQEELITPSSQELHWLGSLPHVPDLLFYLTNQKMKIHLFRGYFGLTRTASAALPPLKPLPVYLWLHIMLNIYSIWKSYTCHIHVVVQYPQKRRVTMSKRVCGVHKAFKIKNSDLLIFKQVRWRNWESSSKDIWWLYMKWS